MKTKVMNNLETLIRTSKVREMVMMGTTPKKTIRKKNPEEERKPNDHVYTRNS